MPDLKFLCPILWEDLAIKNDGDYRVCCNFSRSVEDGVLKNNSGTNLNIHGHNFDDLRNHRIFQSTRKSFLNGQWPKGCDQCKGQEAIGMASMRSHRMVRLIDEGKQEEFEEKVRRFTATDGSIQVEQFPLRELDIRFGNLCNLRCRSCNPANSSALHNDYFQLGYSNYHDGGQLVVSYESDSNRKMIKTFDAFARKKETSFFDTLPKNLDSISRIYFAGGEPLIDPRHETFLKELIKKGLAPQIYLEYNTNLSILSDRIFDLWGNFKKVGLGVSLDGIYEHHEYFRFPSKFSRIEENLRKIDSFGDKLRGWISFTVSSLNISNLPDTIIWLAEQKFQNIGNRGNRPPISAHLLYSPDHLSIQKIPAEAKLLIKKRLYSGFERIKEHPNLQKEKLSATKKMFDGLISHMFEKDFSSECSALWSINLKLDQIRAQSFYTVDPELYSIFSLDRSNSNTSYSVTGPALNSSL
jgi:organic radical activating enzyme